MKSKFHIIIHIVILSFIYYATTIHNIGFNGKFSDLLSFLSIAVGFCITSLSLIATTKFARVLYLEQSKDNNSQTLLHHLVQKFQKANFSFFSGIVSILVYLLISDSKLNLNPIIYGYNISILKLIETLVIFFILIGMWQFIKLMKIMGQYVIQSGKQI